MHQRDGTPLTERILSHLPGPRLGWVLVWAGFQSAFFISAAAYGVLPPPGSTYQPGDVVVLSLVLAYAILFSLWGTSRISSLVGRLRPVYAALVPENQTVEESWPFRSIGDAAGPVVITTVFAVTFAGPELVHAPGWVTVLAAVILFVSSLPGSTLIWVYGSILWGLNRLGRADLRLAPFEEDASLGLGPFGTLAVVAFVFVIAFYAPLVIGRREIRSLLFEFLTFVSIVVLLFLSVYRLHRRLVAERSKHLAWVRRRYGHAFRMATGDAAAGSILERAAELQVAAEAERRAAAIQTWPFDVSAFRIIGALVTSVLAAMIARFVLSRLGL